MRPQAPDVARVNRTVEAGPAVSRGIGREIVNLQNCAGVLIHRDAAVRDPEVSARITTTYDAFALSGSITPSTVAPGIVCRATASAWSTLMELRPAASVDSAGCRTKKVPMSA